MGLDQSTIECHDLDWQRLGADGVGVLVGTLDERLAVAAGLPRIRLHDLRNGRASLALQAGVRVKVVSERLAHASVGMTLDVYRHVIPARRKGGHLQEVLDGPWRTRTSNLGIKSPLLYQLS
jgi:hypothetical protein